MFKNKKMKKHADAINSHKDCILELQLQVSDIERRMKDVEKVTEANRENLNLLLSYMGLHVEQINEKCIVEDEWEDCDCTCGENESCSNCE